LAEIGAIVCRAFGCSIKLTIWTTQPEERTAELQAKYPGCIVISARREDDIAELHQAILRFFQKDLIESEFFAACNVLKERAGDAGAFFRSRATLDVIATMNKLPGDAC
jgi:GTP-binding protein HflX